MEALVKPPDLLTFLLVPVNHALAARLRHLAPDGYKYAQQGDDRRNKGA
ncbi:hypothetical protein [Marinobacter mobilis]